MGGIGMPEIIILLVLGVAISRVYRSTRAAGRTSSNAGYYLAGLVIGALIGFLLRPSVPLLGQLPFSAVITRGASLQGVDVLAKSAAEQSFNYMLAGAILGVVAAVLYVRRKDVVGR